MSNILNYVGTKWDAIGIDEMQCQDDEYPYITDWQHYFVSHKSYMWWHVIAIHSDGKTTGDYEPIYYTCEPSDDWFIVEYYTEDGYRWEFIPF